MLIITSANDNGVTALKVINENNLVEDIHNFIFTSELEKEEYALENEIEISELSNKEVLIGIIRCSFIDGDSSVMYQLFDENGKEVTL